MVSLTSCDFEEVLSQCQAFFLSSLPFFLSLSLSIHVLILFQILFPFRELQNIEQSFLCCTVGPCYPF